MRCCKQLTTIAQRFLQRSLMQASYINPVYIQRFRFSKEKPHKEVSYTLSELNELRSLSGAPIPECKQALVNTSDATKRITSALDWLHQRGKTVRQTQQQTIDIAKHGFIGMFTGTNDAALIEVNCVTERVEHNPIFQNAVLNIGNTIHQNENDIFPNYGLSVEEILKLPIIEFKTNQQSSQTIDETLTDIINSVHENLLFRRAYKMHCPKSGVICGYLHGQSNDNLGMRGSLVSIETDLTELDDDQQLKLKELGQNVAAHIVANYPEPRYITRDELTEREIKKERELIEKTYLEKGDSDAVQDQINERMDQFFEGNVLMEQSFYMSPQLTVGKMVNMKEKQLNCNVKIAHMVCYDVGKA